MKPEIVCSSTASRKCMKNLLKNQVIVWIAGGVSPSIKKLFFSSSFISFLGFLKTLCQCFVNRTSKFIRLPHCSRKTMVASKRHENLFWFKPKPYVQSHR